MIQKRITSSVDELDYNTFINENHSHSVPDIEFNDRFINDAIASNLINHPDLIVKSPCNTGKSYSLAYQIAKQQAGCLSIIVIHLAELCETTATQIKDRLEPIYKENPFIPRSKKTILNYKQLTSDNARTADAIVTTFNSLPKVMDLLGNREINILAFDEAEGGSKFVNSKTLENKQLAFEAITEAQEKAKHVVLFDAFCGYGVEAFKKTFLIDREFTQLNNKYTPWVDHTYSLYSDRNSGFSRFVDLLDQGRNVFLMATSRRLCEKLHTRATDAGISPDDILCAFNSSKIEVDKKALEECKNNPDLFSRYKVVIGSPSLGTGISIECKHFDNVMLFAVHDVKTPDAIQTLQQAFRVRNIGAKHIDLVYIDQSGRDAPPNMAQAKAAMRAKLREIETLTKRGRDCDSFSDNQKIKIAWFENYQIVLAENHHADFENYLTVITDQFEQLQIKEVAAIEYSTAKEKEQYEKIKEKHNALELAALVDAAPIDSDKAYEIRKLLDNGKASRSDQASLERFDLISEYHHSGDTVTPEQIEAYLKLKNDGIKTKSENLALALATKKEISNYTKALRDDSGILKQLDKHSLYDAEISINHKMMLALGSLIELNIGDDGKYAINLDAEYSLKYLKAGGAYRDNSSHLANIKRAYKPWAEINYQNTKAIDKKPAETVLKLMRELFGLKCSKVRNQPAFTIDKEQPVIDHLQAKHDRGREVGIFRQLTKLSAHKNAVEIQKTFGIDRQVTAFITHSLERVDLDHHLEVAERYRSVVCDKLSAGCSPQQGLFAANQMLINRTGYHVRA